MTKMNRFFAMAMAMAMTAAAAGSVSSFAADEEGPKTIKEGCSGYTETDLTVDVDADKEGTDDAVLYGGTAEVVEDEIKTIARKESEPVIYVEVEWEEMKFVYDFGTVDKYEWDLDLCDYVPSYTYVNGKGKGWIDNDAVVTFTNYSNRDVYVGVSFEMNAEYSGKGMLYENVDVDFDMYEDLMFSDVCRGKEYADTREFTMTVSGEPMNTFSKGEMPALGTLKFYISEEARIKPAEEPAAETAETPSGEHEHHYVYDQFGRLVCTGCNAVKHEYCIDEDEDGLCDECGLERDFCPDCHIGGTCRCI